VLKEASSKGISLPSTPSIQKLEGGAQGRATPRYVSFKNKYKSRQYFSALFIHMLCCGLVGVSACICFLLVCLTLCMKNVRGNRALCANFQTWLSVAKNWSTNVW